MQTCISGPARAVLLLLVLVGGGACSALPSEEPPGADSTLVEVLLELHLAKVRHAEHGDLSATERDSILARFNLNPATYATRMAYYVEHPDAYSELYRRLLDRLSEERAIQREALVGEDPVP